MRVVALAGGVGGAKLADGLARLLSPEELVIVVNTGDDFIHFGLSISPDLDTVCYTLAGLANPETGWGRLDESWTALETVRMLGGPGWFQLGDKDLGLHLERTRRLLGGETLDVITVDFCASLGVNHRILPMCNDSVPTWVYTDEGEMPFQEYFVRRMCQPRVSGFKFKDVSRASPAPGVVRSIQDADLVVLCPSNPWVSLDPILAVPGIRGAVTEKLVVAVSPIIAGKTVKGPAAKMYTELGIEPSAIAVAHHYEDTLDGFVMDQVDAGLTDQVLRAGIIPHVTNTIMQTREDRVYLAGEVLSFAQRLEKSPDKGE